MAELYRSDIIKVDINKSLNRMYVGGVLATGDNKANRFGANVYRGGEPVILDSCGVTGYFIRPNMETVVIKGVSDGNTAYVDLEQACYSHEGQFSLAIKVSSDGVVHTVRIVDGYIRLTQTDVLIDPGEVVPTLDDIFAQIAAMEAAEGKANAAAEYANQAASEAINATLDLMGVAAPAIIQSINGDGIVAVSDSAARTLTGMSVYGKTTQDGTPTPEAPVEPEHAGADGAVSVMLAGKNLFQDRRTSQADYTSNGITFVTNADGTFTANGTNDSASRSTMTFTPTGKWLYLPAGTYTVSSGLPNSDAYFQLSHNDEPSSSGSTAVYVYGTPKAITLDKPKWVWMSINVSAGKTAENLVFKPQIEVGAVATEYEPYQEYQTMTAATPNGLPGLPVTSGGNYIDSTGQQWICDEIDFTRGTYIKRIGILTMDGSQICAWTSYPTMPNAGYLFYFLPAADAADPQHIASALSDSFINRAGQAAGQFGHGSFRLTEDGSALTFSLDGVSDTSAAMQWFKEHPATFLYVREHPAGDFLSDDELAAFAALTAHEPHTTLFNDGGAGMALSYIADTKIYIDQRIAALLNA